MTCLFRTKEPNIYFKFLQYARQIHFQSKHSNLLLYSKSDNVIIYTKWIILHSRSLMTGFVLQLFWFLFLFKGSQIKQNCIYKLSRCFHYTCIGDCSIIFLEIFPYMLPCWTLHFLGLHHMSRGHSLIKLQSILLNETGAF